MLVSQGRSLADAYQEAGFECNRTTAYVNGHRLSFKPAVYDYISALVEAASLARKEARYKEMEAESERHFQALRAKLMR